MNRAVLDKLLTYAVRRNASDIHLASGYAPIFRVHGKLRKVDAKTIHPDELNKLIKEILTPEQLKVFFAEKELDFAYAVKGVARFRTNIYQQLNGPSIAFRVIPERIRTLVELEVPKGVYKLARSREGLVLVTGPTGSGKSTTLAAMIDLIDTERHLHIITIEDPIEYVYKGKNCLINQRELGLHTKSFANALRAALREDPDVILIGEMRDLETISLALTAAETGHLVFATLHTNSAAETIDRIVDVFPSGQQDQIRAQFSNSVLGIISQRLVLTKDGRGRVAAMEILIATPAVRNLIREHKVHQIHSVLQTGSKYGMQSMDQHLMLLLQQGKISREEAAAYAHDENFFRKIA